MSSTLGCLWGSLLCWSELGHGRRSSLLLRPWDIPGKKTGVGCHFLLQGIFLTQGLNPRFLNSSAGKESARNARDPGLIPELERSPGEGIGYPLQYSRASLAAQLVKNLPAMGEFSSAQSLSRV